MATTNQTERLYRIPEVAALLGVDRATVYRLIADGRLRAVHLEGLKSRPQRVLASSVAAYVDRLRPVAAVKP